MYSEVLDFLIVSENQWLEQRLQEMSPIEDCTYYFSTRAGLGAEPGILEKRNRAVILDAGMVSEQAADVMKHWAQERENGKDVPVTAAILLDGHTEASAGWRREIDYLWLLSSRDDAETLKVYFARLVSEMKERADARKQTICFQTLIDSSKDLIWFKDVDGRHLIVNDEFCSFVNKSKKQIYKQGHCYIWDASKEDEKVCLDSDREIMKGRRTRRFEEQVHTNSGDYIIQSYKSPLTEQGEIFGTCGIGKNITSERNLEKKLQTILDHIPFAVAVVNKEEVLTYKNEMFDTYFPEAVDYLGRNVTALKKQLHFPDHMEEGETAEIEIPVFDAEPTWFSYCEKQILDAFDLQVEKMLVLQDITVNKKLERQKERMAYTDYLTGLSNRRGMLKTLENEKDTSGLTVILIDIDNFKKINDTMGHVTGDEVLKDFAGKLEKVFAADFSARYGGDEFLVITRLDQKDSIQEKVVSLQREAECIVCGGGQQRGITVSCGISVGAETGSCSLEELIRMSDEAMYYIKKHGKHGFCFYDEMVGKK